MSVIDIILVVCVAGGLILGYRRGALRQIGSIGGVVAGLIACRMAGAKVAAWVTEHLSSLEAQPSDMTLYAGQVIGYGGLFLAVWFAVWTVARMLRKATHAMLLGPLDGIAGSLFLAFKWVMVLSLVLNLWKVVDPDSGLFGMSRIADGKLLAGVLDLTPWLLGFLKDVATNHNVTLL